jgi:hypothetical protein
MTQYTIVGDTKNYTGCLVYACGSSLENAKETLQRMLTNPSENDLAVSKGHTNLRIEKEEDEDKCWWLENLDKALQ